MKQENKYVSGYSAMKRYARASRCARIRFMNNVAARLAASLKTGYRRKTKCSHL